MEPIGQQLREARERRGVTLDAVKRELRITAPTWRRWKLRSLPRCQPPPMPALFCASMPPTLAWTRSRWWRPTTPAPGMRSRAQCRLDGGTASPTKLERPDGFGACRPRRGPPAGGRLRDPQLPGRQGGDARQIASSKSAPRPATAKAPTAATLERPVGAPDERRRGGYRPAGPAVQGCQHSPANAAAPRDRLCRSRGGAPSGGIPWRLRRRAWWPGSANAPLAP